VGAASVLLATTGSALAQDDYPSRLIRIVMAWPPGSGGDVLVRLMTDPLRAELGQPLVIENKAGAAGVIGAEIAALAPEIPTLEELGYKDFNAAYWNGLLGPKGLPLPIANRVAAAVNRVLARPDVLAKMEPLANEIDGKSDPQSFAAMMKEDLATWIGVAKAANIKPE